VVEQAVSDTIATAKTRAAAPGWDDLRSEFGGKMSLAESPDGRKKATIDLSDEADRRRYNGMMEQWRNGETEVGAERNARIPTIDLVDPGGKFHRLSAVEGERRARALGMVSPGRPVFFFSGGVAGRWLQCGHRASFAMADGRCAICEGER
jgi:hypothetical protein